MMCKSRTQIKTMINGLPHLITVPCGKCLPCRINHTSEWTMRLLMELEEHKTASFVTLTYNNDNLPQDRGLHKEDLSSFNKAFRQDFENPIRFFACGEYGDNPERLTFFGDKCDPEIIKRPHYHSIMFGVDNSLATRELLFKDWNKCDSWKFFGRTWYKTVGNVNHDSIQYVAGYCQKKLFGDQAKDEYGEKQAPFQLQSKRIGEEYFLKHIDEYVKLGYIPFRGKMYPIPSTWKRKFNINFSYEKIVESLERVIKQYNEYFHTDWTIEKLQKLQVGFNKNSDKLMYSITDFLYYINPEYQYFIDFKNNLRRSKSK